MNFNSWLMVKIKVKKRESNNDILHCVWIVHIQSRESDRKQMELNTIYSIIVPRVVSLSLLYHISTWIEETIFCIVQFQIIISYSWNVIQIDEICLIQKINNSILIFRYIFILNINRNTYINLEIALSKITAVIR